MAVEYVIVNGTTLSGTTGTKDYTSSGFGTPQAAMVFMGRLDATSPSNSLGTSVGITDGTREFCCHVVAIHNQATSDCDRFHSDSALGHYQPGTDEFEFSAWITDGIRLNFTDSFAQARELVIVLFKGLTNAYAGSVSLSTGVNDITSPGFKPDAVFCMSVGFALTPPATGTQGIFSAGWAHNNSSDVVSQASIGYVSETGQASTDVGVMLRNDACVTVLKTDGTVRFQCEAESFDANGFSLDTGTDDPGSNYVFYLALELDDPDDFDVSIIDTPTSTGNQAYTDPGFEPNFLHLIESNIATVNTATSANGTFCFGWGDDTNEYCYGYADEDNVTVSNTQNNFTSTAIAEVYDEGGADTIFDATINSFDASGFTLNFTDTEGTAKKWIAVSFKDTSAVGYTLSCDSGSYAATGTAATLQHDKEVDASSAAYAWTGSDATLTYAPAGAYTIVADAGSYALTGSDVTLTWSGTPPVPYDVSWKGGGRILREGKMPKWWDEWDEPQPQTESAPPKSDSKERIAEIASGLKIPKTKAPVIELPKKKAPTQPEKPKQKAKAEPPPDDLKLLRAEVSEVTKRMKRMEKRIAALLVLLARRR